MRLTVVVLVPRRDDGGRRDRLWRWCSARWQDLHPEWPVFEGHHDAGPFNRAAALNRAAEAAGRWDVAIVADSDSFVDAFQLERAVTIAARTRQVTFAYDRYAYLGRAMSDRILDGYVGDWWPGVEFTMTGTCSSMVVMPRGPWDLMGGRADEGFVGWGGEDIALSLALQTFGGGMRRVPGEVWHLWHPPAPHTHDDQWPARMQLYADAAYDRGAMRDLIYRLADETIPA